MNGLSGVHHHVLVRRRGGAAKVALMLARAQCVARPVSFSFELDEAGGREGGEPREAFACRPEALASRAPSGSLVHVHATQDWAALLEGFRRDPRPLALTAHDCRLLTGGCVYPLDCPGMAAGCPDPCPRGYGNSEAVSARIRELVAVVRPAVASPSAWLGRQLRRAWPSLSVKVVPNGVEAAPSEGRESARAALGLAGEARVAVFLAHGGREAAYKGGGRFEALWRGIKAREPLAVGVIVGGNRADRQGDLIELPYLEEESLARVLRAGDALLYPSLADNHPLVILEAMAAGLPVAAYAVGGIREQIVSGEQGLLCPPGDEAGLIQAALRLLSDRSLARRLADAAVRRQARHFTLERMAADYDRLYEAALAGRG